MDLSRKMKGETLQVKVLTNALQKQAEGGQPDGTYR